MKIFDEAKEYAEKHLDTAAMQHAIQVVDILKLLTTDEEVIIAGLLHDILEDTSVTPIQLEKRFGKRITALVNEVTHEGAADTHGYYFPRLHSKDAIIIKFADRLSNLTRISEWPKERQTHYLKHSRFWRQKW